jgi:DNA polymerase-3 subunit gamma/tau
VPSSQTQQPSLYRRHRPRTFDDVVGQEPVVRTLRNAVERGKVHHAYLFVGSRGTGKTSMAKILASCLNCERGPTVTPCGVCDSCRSIASASSLDVIEMDAASNNSVDDIRELRESVAYAPVSGRQKIYILDEAHMLSSAAWNAFLKTLEEPPPDTVFVLATTEAQKVPATVVDRCHRFDFHRPTVEQIASVVRRVAAAESIEIPAEAAAAVARSATGSFRDALGTLEQLVTYSGQRIALEDVLAVLGVTDTQLLEEVFDAVDRGDARRVLLAVAECAESGRDPSSFAADLEVRARELLVVQTLGEVPAELSLTPEADTRLAEQAGRVAHDMVVRVLELLGVALEGVRAGGEARTQLELALVKAAKPEVDGSMRALLARIERLEAGRAPVAAVAQPAVSGSLGAASVGNVSEAAARTDPGGPPEPEPVAPSGPGGGVSSPEPAAPSASAAPVSTTSAPGPATPAPTSARPAEPTSPTVPATSEAPSAAAAPPDSPPVPATVTPMPETVAGDIESLSAIWPAVVSLVRSENALLGALIAEARPVGVLDEELTVAFATTASFLKKKAEDPAHRQTVGQALSQVAGRRLRPIYELREELPALAETDSLGSVHTDEEWVARFVDEFDAEELPGERVPQTSEKGE